MICKKKFKLNYYNKSIKLIYLLSLYLKKCYKEKVFKKNFLQLIFYILCGIIINLTMPFVLKFYITKADQIQYIQIAGWLLLIYCVFFTLNKFTVVTNTYLVSNLISKISCVINIDFINQVLKLDRKYCSNLDIGYITSSLSKAQTALPTILSTLTIIVIPLIIEFIIFAIVIFNLYGIQFFLYFVLMVTIFCYLSIQLSINLKKYLMTSNQLQNKSSSYLIDILYNYDNISYFGIKNIVIKNYSKYLTFRQENDLQYNWKVFINRILQNLIFSIVFTLILSLINSNKDYNISDIIFINAFLLQLLQPLTSLDSVFRNFNKALTEFSELLGILFSPRKQYTARSIPKTYIDDNDYILAFYNVNFAYDKAKPLFLNLSLHIKTGDRILFMSPSGSGKSTLIKLIYKLYNIDTGYIVINGKSIEEIQLSEITSKISIAPQEVKIFNASIVSNITFFIEPINYFKLKEALKFAALENFIQNLPDGYDTMLGSDGINLSGGERQRLAIARMFYSNPILYIFDESFSAIDSNNQDIITTSINNIGNSKSLIFIAHQKPKNIIFNKIMSINNNKINIKCVG
jgi:ABC-type multidrug transport system fused ATPase/permease subunit